MDSKSNGQGDGMNLRAMMFGCWPYLRRMETSSSQSRLLLSITFTAYSTCKTCSMCVCVREREIKDVKG